MSVPEVRCAEIHSAERFPQLAQTLVVEKCLNIVVYPSVRVGQVAVPSQRTLHCENSGRLLSEDRIQ